MAENGTILVIDSDASGLQGICEVLELEGYDMLQASSGVQGITLAQQHLPNLIICVSYLRDISPEEMIQQLRENPQTDGIPLLVILRKGGGAYAYSRYTNAFLSVPFTAEDLIEAADHTIRKDDGYWTKRSDPLGSLPSETPMVDLSGYNLVLVIENFGLQVLTKIMLERGDCKVFGVKDQDMLDNLLDEQSVDLIILDADTNALNATQRISHIRRRPSTKETPILVFVPRSNSDLVIKCLQAGATDYLPKPVLAYDLLLKVDAMLKPNIDGNDFTKKL